MSQDLVHSRDRVVSKEDLLEAIWGGRLISESTFFTRINAVRRAVGDDGKKQRLIRTMPRRGFRFIGEAAEVSADVALRALKLKPDAAKMPHGTETRPFEPASTYRENLPRLAHALIGRERDVAEIEALLSTKRPFAVCFVQHWRKGSERFGQKRTVPNSACLICDGSPKD